MCACVPVHAVYAHMHECICIRMSVCVRQIERGQKTAYRS